MMKGGNTMASPIEDMQLFRSQFTGEEVERGLATAVGLEADFRDNFIPSAVPFTGDFREVVITTLTRWMYLERIIVTCNTAFSKSVHIHRYAIGISGRDLVELSTEFMQDPGAVQIFYVNENFRPGTRFRVYSDSTQAYGEISVKLIFS